MGPLTRWARFVTRHHRRVLWLSLVLVLVGFALAPVFRANLLGLGYDTPGTESDRATQLIRERTGVGERSLLVVSADRPGADGEAVRRALVEAAKVVRTERSVVTAVLEPGRPGGGAVSRDGRVRTATVLMTGAIADRQEASSDLQEALARFAPPGVTAALTGPSPLLGDLVRVETEDLLLAEVVGLPIALLVLLLTLRSVVAAGLPLLLGLAGLGACFGILAATLPFADWNLFVETLFAMIGLGVGIDYALLVVRRYREELAAGREPPAALERTFETAGRTVVISGAIVALSMLGLALTKLPFFAEAAVAVMLVVGLMVLGALTLLPALLVRLGDGLERWRIPEPRRRRRSRAARPVGDAGATGAVAAGGAAAPEVAGTTDLPAADAAAARWARWARFVVRRPWPVALVAVAVLLAAASPALDLRTGTDLNARAMAGEPAADALGVVERAFPDASLAPVQVLVRPGSADPGPAVERVRAVLERERELGPVSTAPVGGRDAVLVATPTVAVDSIEADRLVRRLRPAVREAAPPGASVLVTGTTAELVDFTDETNGATPFVLVFTLTLAFLLLTSVFRSPLLAVKAIVMNLLSVLAAIGLTVLLFQEGHAESLFGFTSLGYLQGWMPLTLFMIVFGLSMDYEVFIVTRMREEYERTGDTDAAIVGGLARTGTVVTSAAAIMVAIFGSFVLTSIPEIKQMGFGLAAAVLIDATVVRAALVPAFMRLAGRWNWWMPAWLDRLLPTIRESPPPENAPAPR